MIFKELVEMQYFASRNEMISLRIISQTCLTGLAGDAKYCFSTTVKAIIFFICTFTYPHISTLKYLHIDTIITFSYHPLPFMIKTCY